MEDEQFELPDAMVEGLREAYTHRVEISAERERAVLGAARAEFGRRRRMRMVRRWGAGVAAGIAAMIVVVVSLPHGEPQRAVAKGDVNADGRVDIVDVLVLARHVSDGEKLEKAWDVNGDGVVDQKDVDALGRAAVSLKGGAVARGRLPGLRELGIDRRVGVGLASASDGLGGPRGNTGLTLAEARSAGGKTLAEARSVGATTLAEAKTLAEASPTNVAKTLAEASPTNDGGEPR